MNTPVRLSAPTRPTVGITSIALILAGLFSAAGPLAGQVCLGTGLSEGGGAGRAHAGAVSNVAVVGAAVFLDPVSPFGAMGQAELATVDEGHGIHLGGRGIYQVGPPLGTTLCLTAGASFYQSEGRAQDFEGDRPRPNGFRIYSPAVGLAVGAAHVDGPLVINRYALAEGHLVYKHARFDRGTPGTHGWEGYSNEARAVVELGVGLQWRRLLVDGALLAYPGTHSIIEAFRGSDPAGGIHAGFRFALGLVF